MATNSMKPPSFKMIDQEIRVLNTELQQEPALMVDIATQEGRVQRLLKIYARLKPLLAVLSVLPLIPNAWRAALALFTQALEAVSAGAADVPVAFKAGKDL